MRGRGSFVPRRQIQVRKKEAAAKYLRTTRDTTPEKEATLEKKYSLTPKSRQRLLKAASARKSPSGKAKRRNFRQKGGGRKLDEWWLQVEPHLIERFKTRRAAGAVVLRSHLPPVPDSLAPPLPDSLDRTVSSTFRTTRCPHSSPFQVCGLWDLRT